MTFTAQQLVERRAGLGASEAAAAVGHSPWQTPLQLYLEKIGEPAPPRNDDEMFPLVLGHIVEPYIIERFEKKHRVTVSSRQQRIVDPSWPERWATVDGVASDGGLVEAKSATVADPEEWGDQYTDDAVPKHYFLQVQHALACTGLAFAWVPLVLFSAREFRIYRVRRDQELIDLLTAKEREFWSLVQARTPPLPQNLEDARRLWPSHMANKKIVATAEVVQAVLALRETKLQIKELDAAKEQFELRIKQHMADAAELVHAKQIICTWKQAKPSRRFDEHAFAAEQPELYRQYQIEVPGSRRMLTPEVKGVMT